MAAHEAYLTHITIVFSVYPRTKHGAPSAFLHGVNAGAPWPACAALEEEDVIRARHPPWQRISIAKRSLCRFGHSQSESFVAVYRAEHEFTQDM